MSRKPKFRDVEELSKKIDEYFKKREEQGKPYTVSGLALELGISTKHLRDYKNCLEDINVLKTLTQEEKEGMSEVVGLAYQKCESYIEDMLLDKKCTKNPVSMIFALKQMGWRDQSEIIQEQKTVTIDIVDDEEEYRPTVKLIK